MIHVDLTPREAETLRTTLEAYLSELQTEIAHTDSATYRGALKERRQLLRRVADRLAGEARAVGR